MENPESCTNIEVRYNVEEKDEEGDRKSWFFSQTKRMFLSREKSLQLQRKLRTEINIGFGNVTQKISTKADLKDIFI